MAKKYIGIKLFFFVSLFFLSSCSSILMGLYGLKNISDINDAEVCSYAESYQIPTKDSYRLEKSYTDFLLSLDTNLFREEIQNHYQPLQALYYDTSGQLQSFHINCYAGGFPNLKWNRNKNMETFPPKQQAPLDTILPLNTQLKYLQALAGSEPFVTEDYEYVVFVYWSANMGRQSKRFIRIVQKNSLLATDNSVKLVYVNTDDR